MSIKPVQNQFNGGEISPYMDGRFDLPAYQYSAALMLNFIPISEGCFKRRGGTHFVAPVKETDAFLFQINPNPAEATVMINNAVQKTCYCAYGDVVSYTVAADGYAPASGTYKIDGNKELDVNLVSVTTKYDFEITAYPEDAKVVINGLERNAITIGAGAKIEWSVSKEGYKTQSGVISAISEDLSFSVDLKMRFSLRAYPEDAKVIINGLERSYIDVNSGEEVEWSVSKEGYKEKSGKQTITSSIEMIVSISSQVAGQVMLETSMAGKYIQTLEAGRYELLMCGQGGNGYNSGTLKPIKGTGGSAAAFKGIIRLTEDVYEIDVGGDTRLGDVVVTGAGKNGAAGNGAGGVISIPDVSKIVSFEVSTNGVKKTEQYRNYCALPSPYKDSYGFGGGNIHNYYWNMGGSAYIKLVYLGE